MADELKPCPFCGSEAELDEDCGKYVVFCTNPNCSWRDTEAEAIEAWNTRAERTCIMEDTTHPANDDVWTSFKCSECHEDTTISREQLKYCPKCGAKVAE